MDVFSVELTERAFSDLCEIYRHIYSQLMESGTALRQRERCKKRCECLEERVPFLLSRLPNVAES